MSAKYLYPKAIVSTQWMSEHLEDPGVRLFECTEYLRPPPPDLDAPYQVESGRADYSRGHLPGAAFIDLQADLSDNTSPPHLRFKLPEFDELASRFMQIGVDESARVVVYSRGSANWATRVWWMLRAVGFDDAAVLDGGFEKWTHENRPLATEAREFAPGKFTPRPRPELFADRAAVVEAMSDGAACTLNALSAELHSGESERYGRAGRIPGSVNVPATALVDPTTLAFVPAELAEKFFNDVGAAPDKRNIVYCGGGIAATLDAFLMHQLGYRDVSVYDASMSEWARDDSLPMERG